jgi:predicted transcriptional regulator
MFLWSKKYRKHICMLRWPCPEARFTMDWLSQDRAKPNSAFPYACCALAIHIKSFQIIKACLNLVNLRRIYYRLYLAPLYCSFGKRTIDMSGSPISYRDRIYIVKDVILKLVEYGELNQTALVSFCGMNLKKHKPILDDLEYNELIERNEMTIGKRTVAVYRPTQKGIAFCRDILEPYEKMFPRKMHEKEE